jgi:hypothetical protein
MKTKILCPHEKYPNDISLEKGLAIVFPVAQSSVTRSI